MSDVQEKRLNFYPHYEELLRTCRKTTTFRVGTHLPYVIGDRVMITVGWVEEEAIELHLARITGVYRRRIRDLRDEDFAGESPDCLEPAATRLVLSAIYKTVLTADDEIWVVKFAHEE